MPSKVPDLGKLVQAGKGFSSEGKATEPTAEQAPEIDFSHVRGKLVHRLESPVSAPDSEPSIEEKFRDAGVYGEAGALVLAAHS
jgi:hypothetical protein